MIDGFTIYTDNRIRGNDKNMCIGNFSISTKSKFLFKDATLRISFGRKYGIVGKNGIGKSTLMKHIVAGEFPICKSMDILYVEQEIDASELSPVDILLRSNKHRYELWIELKGMRNANDVDVDKYNELEGEWNINNYDASESIARRILRGLGFTSENQDSPVSSFSGGWRMRIALAQGLFRKPTVLMLDEPTNHLDLDAVIWLADYLINYPNTVIFVSHNKSFLNEVCTNIIHIDSLKTNQYSGNYDRFLSLHQMKLISLNKEWDKLQKCVKKMKKNGVPKNVVDKFVKDRGALRPSKSYVVNIQFFDPGYIDSLVDMKNVTFGYKNKTIFENVNFTVTSKSKIALVGPNGSGKSTLLNLICGSLEPADGEISVNRQCRVGYYGQHFANSLPHNETPVQYLLNLAENNQEHVRKLLGTIGLEGSHHMNLIGNLSGGQKARVAFVSLFIRKPHLLLLDEPSNHLDIETVSALIDAINGFSSGVIIITHDSELITKTHCQLYTVGNKKVCKFKGDYEDYRSAVLIDINKNDL